MSEELERTEERTDERKKNPLVRANLFTRQVTSELRKVIWPTRKELGTYTGVVIVFVTIMAGIIAVIDLGAAQAVLAVFGN
jgi:preprotein translocase subunit SecE